MNTFTQHNINEWIEAHNISFLKEGVDYKKIRIPNHLFWGYIPLHWKANNLLASALVDKKTIVPLDWYAAQKAFEVIIYIGDNKSKWAVLVHRNRIDFMVYDSRGNTIGNIPKIDVYQYIIKPNRDIIR